MTFTRVPDDEDPPLSDPPFEPTWTGAVAATRLDCDPPDPLDGADPVPPDDGGDPDVCPEPLESEPLDVMPLCDVPLGVDCDAAVEPDGWDGAGAELVAPGAAGAAAEPGH